MKITGWTIQTYTNEYPRLGFIKKHNPVEFGNSPIRDQKARLEHISQLIKDNEIFSVIPIVKGEQQ